MKIQQKNPSTRITEIKTFGGKTISIYKPSEQPQSGAEDWSNQNIEEFICQSNHGVTDEIK
jgi:hypothetical protein